MLKELFLYATNAGRVLLLEYQNSLFSFNKASKRKNKTNSIVRYLIYIEPDVHFFAGKP